MHHYFPILIHSYLPKIQHICFLVTPSDFIITFDDFEYRISYYPSKKTYFYEKNEYSVIADTIINGKQFHNVIFVVADTIKYPNVKTHKLYLAENYGIIKFHQRNPASEWEYMTQ